MALTANSLCLALYIQAANKTCLIPPSCRTVSIQPDLLLIIFHNQAICPKLTVAYKGVCGAAKKPPPVLAKKPPPVLAKKPPPAVAKKPPPAFATKPSPARGTVVRN